MNPSSQVQESEYGQVMRYLQGEEAALAGLRERHNHSLVSILRARGASATEAEELLADLWGDCVSRDDERPSLLEKYSGKCSLHAWLATVATRRWIDLKRRQARRGELQIKDRDGEEIDPFERLPAAPSMSADDSLVTLLRDSLQAAFASCPKSDILMLRLVYVHGLSQRELMRMWGWSESKVSRRLSQALGQLEIKTMEHLRQRDAWLELTWQDFVDLCETHQVGFL